MAINQLNQTHEAHEQYSTDVTDETPDVKISSKNMTPEELQRRTFSHYPHSPRFIDPMMQAGFSSCNVGDRVICLECYRVYEGWKPNIDNPCEIHRVTSPDCTYVQSKLMDHPGTMSPPTRSIHVNISPTVSVARSSTVRRASKSPFSYVESVPKCSPNSIYAELTERQKSFDSWPNSNSPSVADLVRAGFFYTGTRNIVTCFYCNGSLHDWGANDNPKVEHVRWFPECVYACQLCGHELCQKIQESKRLLQGFF